MSGELESIFSSPNERVYKVFFNHIRHENKLMIERMRNMLQFQSLLLIAYAATFNGVISLAANPSSGRALDYVTWYVPLFQTLVCLAGCYASVSAATSIGAAWRAMEGYEQQFYAKCREVPSLAGWPPLRGAGIENLHLLGGRVVRATPWAFLVVWILVLALTGVSSAMVLTML